MMMTLAQLAGWLPGARLIGDPAHAVLRVHSDTRSLQPGDLFVALAGERFDAHRFLPQAKSLGAAAGLAQHRLADAGWCGVEVPDTRLALGQLAAAWREQFTLPLIAVTGSNGKTTVTQMTAAILRAAAPDAALATEGNFNNDIGVPLTLLRLRAAHRLAVIEIGMNHPGEIAGLAAMAQPSVVLVNNAQREHMEFMASVEAVARENGSAIAALPSDGTVVFPHDEAHAALWREMAGGRRCATFAQRTDGKADVRLESAEWAADGWVVQAATPAGTLRYRLAAPGMHNVLNSLAAATSAWAAGVDLRAIAEGLAAFAPVAGRSAAFSLTLGERQITVVDDSYNANPDSVHAAIRLLAELPGPRLLVLGDMGEVGDQGEAFHREVGAAAQQRKIDALMTLGAQSHEAAAAFAGGKPFDEIEAICAAVTDALPHVASVLVKGSRFMRIGACRHRHQVRWEHCPCCLASPNGCRRCRRSSDFSGCSSI